MNKPEVESIVQSPEQVGEYAAIAEISADEKWALLFFTDPLSSGGSVTWRWVPYSSLIPVPFRSTNHVSKSEAVEAFLWDYTHDPDFRHICWQVLLDKEKEGVHNG